MSQCLQVVTSVSLQGGGSGSECDDSTDPFNGKRFTVRMFLPMEVVTMPQRRKVVEFGSLIEIPKYVRPSATCASNKAIILTSFHT